MPKLPDVYGERGAPRFGGVRKVAPLVAPVTETGWGAMASAVEGFGKEIEQHQIRADKYAAMDAVTKLETKLIENRTGEKGWEHQKESDVGKTWYKDEETRLSQTISDGGIGLEGRALKSYQLESNNISNRVKGNLINHATVQKAAAETRTFEATMLANIENAKLNWGNENEVKGFILANRKALDVRGEDMGIEGVALEQQQKIAESEIHAGVIAKAVDEDSYGYAQIWFNKNKKFMTSEDQAAAKDLLEDGNLREKSQAAVDDYVGRGLTETEARAEARTYTGAERDAILTRISARYGEDAKMLDADQKAAGESAWEIYGETRDISSVPLSTMREMDGQARVALEDYAKQQSEGKSIKTDFKTYYSLMNMANDDPEAFRDYDLNKVANVIGLTEMKELVKLQKDPKKIDVLRTNTQIISDALQDIGLESGDLTDDGDDGDEARAFRMGIENELKQQQDETGKPFTQDQVKEVVDRHTIKVLRARTWWFGNKEIPAYKIDIEGVPKEEVDELAEAVRDAGELVTEGNIKLLYDRLKSEK